MKKFLIFILLLINSFTYGQCVGTQTFTLNPPPPAGGYLPGTAVTVCYTMNNWPGLNFNTNWLEGFDINLGPGWTNLTPMGAPANCGGPSTGGNWLWLNTSTSVSTGITIGPGWFFNSQQGCFICNNAIAGDDWGDYGNCVWNFCFQVTVANVCTPQNLLIQVTAGADGTWGSWTSNSCPTTPFTIYNGVINTTLPAITNINHN